MTLVSTVNIGPYRVLESIGFGGMATVYRAVDPQTGSDVAVKLMNEELTRDRQFSRRFQREGQVLHKLRHPSIVAILDVGEHNGRPYLVMPCLSGGALAARLNRGPRPLPEIMALLPPIAAALDYAHSQGVIHRDIKPLNILFDADDRPYLTDFGIVKVVGETQTVTRQSVVLGTPGYMSPEQLLGKHLDGRADVYALGVVLFEMLTGRLPFVADSSPFAAGMKHITEPLPRLRDIAPGLHSGWQPILARALAKERDARYPTATALAEAAVAQARVAMVSPPRPAARRPAMALVALAALLLGGLMWALFSRPPTGITPIAGPTTVATEPPRATSTAAPTGMTITINDPVSSPTPVGPPRVRLIEEAKLRAGPGSLYDALGELAAGVEATILGRDLVWSWYNVLLDDGRRGWLPGVALLLLDPNAQAGIEPAATIPGPPVTARPTTLAGLPTLAPPATFTPLPAVRAATAVLPTAVVAPPAALPSTNNPQPESPTPVPPPPTLLPTPEPPPTLEPTLLPTPVTPPTVCPYPPAPYPPPGC